MFVLLNKTKLGQKVTGLKTKARKWGIIGGVLLVLYGAFNIADKYFNKDTAEANLVVHIEQLYGKKPTSYTCANVDSSNYDSRVTCEAVVDGKVKTYACRGLFDSFDSSCIPIKNYVTK